MLKKMSIRNKVAIETETASSIFGHAYEGMLQKVTFLNYLIFKKWEVPFIIMGFLLGRAMILNQLSPFAIPFFAVMYHLKKDKLLYITFAILIGTNLATTNQMIVVLFGMVLFFFLQRYLVKKNKSDLNYVPFLVAVSIFIPKITLHIYHHVDQLYPWLMVTIEASLGFVLTLIFVQAMPILVFRKQLTLSQEEIIALTIVLASVMSGTIGWSISGFSLEHIFSRYFILLFALVGGGAIGASIGVVTGLVLSLANSNAIYQMSLLAFSGLLAGLMKQANKLGVAAGLLLGTTILSIYLDNQIDILTTFYESSVAIALFILTPKSLIKEIAKFIPGTNEYHHHYQDYVSQIRDITSKKIEQFSNMFSQLAISFKDISTSPMIDQSEQLDHFMNKVAEENCKTCWKRNKCWNDEFFKTYRLMTELMTQIEINGEISKKDIPSDWVHYCVKYDQVAFQLTDIYKSYGDHLYWKNQLEESRLLVSHQLYGVSQVMMDLAKDIQKEGKELGIQEQQLQQSLEKLGLSIRRVNVLSLEEGNVEIEVIQPSCHGVEECTKIVAPLISEVIGENIVVKDKQCKYSDDGTCKMCLKSAKTYEVSTGFASAAKGGKWLSGDSFSTIEISNGKYAVALSDGMGNGERAQKESKATLELLQQLLHSGIDETLSIKTINSVLLLRSQEEIFSTVDLAIIDLYNGFTKFLKVGSTPSFIKRGDEIIVVSANNLPIGIIQDIDIDSKEHHLIPDDILVMITDGIYDTPQNTHNREIWMKRLIKEIQTDDPQAFADLLLEKVIRFGQGEIKDDMTVIVSKITEYIPEWATIKVPGLQKIDRDTLIN